MLNNFTEYKNKNGSLFISFEGIEGSGKSTQIEYLKEYLIDQGLRVLLLREPGGSIFGEKLRSAILNSETPISPLAEAHLFASSRAQLLSEKILPFLEQQNSAVLLDRYIDSSLAYQGIARGLGLQTILDIHAHSPLNILPNRTFYLKIDLETSQKRQHARGNKKDYFEKENHDFYQKLIQGFDEASALFQKRIAVIDGKKTMPEIQAEIAKKISEIL